MKKILLILFILLLSGCGTNNNISINNTEKKQVFLPAISTGFTQGVMVAVSDPHIYSHKGPQLISGSFYFSPLNFYQPIKNTKVFSKAYASTFDVQKIYYYDENHGAQAGLVVYVLRNIYHKDNVSLLETDLSKYLKFNQKYYPVPSNFSFSTYNVTGGYIGTGKYLLVYKPNLIKFKTGDLLLYSCDVGTMKLDPFYQKAKNIHIESFDWSKLIDINGNLKSYSEISRLLKPLKLENYKKVYIYYPQARYRSAVLALYLQQYFGK